jgi:hypothetical protein
LPPRSNSRRRPSREHKKPKRGPPPPKEVGAPRRPPSGVCLPPPRLRLHPHPHPRLRPHLRPSSSSQARLYSPDCLEVWNSRKSAYSIVHITPPQSRKARSLTHPRPVRNPYTLWCWIDIRDRECSTATVDLDRTTHVSCVALHTPVSGVASPTPRLARRQQDRMGA